MSLAAYRSALSQDCISWRLRLFHDGQAVTSNQNISVHNGIKAALKERKRHCATRQTRKRNAANASARTRFRATSYSSSAGAGRRPPTLALTMTSTLRCLSQRG